MIILLYGTILQNGNIYKYYLNFNTFSHDCFCLRLSKYKIHKYPLIFKVRKIKTKTKMPLFSFDFGFLSIDTQKSI